MTDTPAVGERIEVSRLRTLLRSIAAELDAIDAEAEEMENTCLSPPCAHSIGYRESARRLRELIEEHGE